MEVDLSEYDIQQIEKGELARLYMIEIAGHFEKHNTLTKDLFFEFGKRTTTKFKKNIEEAKY